MKQKHLVLQLFTNAMKQKIYFYNCLRVQRSRKFSYIIIYECNEAEYLVVARETIYDITDCDIF